MMRLLSLTGWTWHQAFDRAVIALGVLLLLALLLL